MSRVIVSPLPVVSYVSSVPVVLSSLSLGPSKRRSLKIRGGSGVGTRRGVRVRGEPPPRNILRRQECRSLSAWSSSPPLNPTKVKHLPTPLTQWGSTQQSRSVASLWVQPQHGAISGDALFTQPCAEQKWRGIVWTQQPPLDTWSIDCLAPWLYLVGSERCGIWISNACKDRGVELHNQGGLVYTSHHAVNLEFSDPPVACVAGGMSEWGKATPWVTLQT